MTGYINPNVGRRTRRWVTKIKPACRKRDQDADAPCWICGQPIDYTLTYPHPESWSPDHVYIVRDYPDLAEDPANIRAAHLTCNKSRGASVTTTTRLGNNSRKW